MTESHYSGILESVLFVFMPSSPLPSSANPNKPEKKRKIRLVPGAHAVMRLETRREALMSFGLAPDTYEKVQRKMRAVALKSRRDKERQIRDQENQENAQNTEA